MAKEEIKLEDLKKITGVAKNLTPKQKIKPKISWNAILGVSIFWLAVIAVYLLLVGVPKSPQPSQQLVFDDHGCYTNAGYSWCAPKTKCIKLSVEDCAKIDLGSQMCAGYQESAVQNNITAIKYTYDDATKTCLVTDRFAADLTIWSITCENEQAKASLEIRNSNATQAELEQAFNGCVIRG